MFWKILDDHYVKSAVVNFEEILARDGIKIPSKCVTQFSSKYSPLLEESP